MKHWQPDRLSRKGPLYIAIADALQQDLERGRLRQGERLPTHRDLAAQLGVNVMTVTRGYAEAGRRGLVEGEVGRGTFVRRMSRQDVSFVPLESNGRPLIDFHFNVPRGDPALLDTREAFEELAADPQLASLHEGYSALGLDEHRVAGAEWMARNGLDADPARTVITGGAQHAMMLAIAAHTSPGDVLLTEELTYPGVKALASILHLRPHGIAMDGEGLLPEALDAACRKHDAKVLYCMPTVQNPTGVVMPAGRREEVAAIARRHGLAVIEDDTYGFACADAPPPLSNLCPERCYYVTSTSKSIASGLRIGFLHAPDSDGPVLERLAANVAATAWMAAPLMARLTCRFLANGAAEAMIRWKREEATARRTMFAKLVSPGRSAGASGSAGPSGSAGLGGASTSPHLWFPLPEPWGSEDFARQARQRGVAVTPAEAFVVSRAPAPNAVRVCLGTPKSREEVERGLGVLSRLCASVPELAQPFV